MSSATTGLACGRRRGKVYGWSKSSKCGLKVAKFAIMHNEAYGRVYRYDHPLLLSRSRKGTG